MLLSLIIYCYHCHYYYHCLLLLSLYFGIIIILYIVIIKTKERSKEQSIARQQKTNKYEKKNLSTNINMISLSLNELKLVAKNRGIKDYENKSEDDLIKILSELKTKISVSKKKIKSIKKILIN